MFNIDDFINEIEQNKIELHSCIIKKDKDFLCRLSALPYTLEQPQMLFSMTKSFVSIAIGYLYEEKRIHLDDFMMDYFPEKKAVVSDKISKIRIVHLLTMTTGSIHEQSIFMQENWLDAYLNQTLKDEAGTFFHYNSMNTYILSVIITRITGKTCNDYLYEKLFQPLNITKPQFDCCAKGYNTGGWGLYLSPNDLIKIADAIITRSPLLPMTYIDKMITKKVTSEHFNKDNYHQQYGYLCWINPENCGIRFDGVFGQIMILIPERKMYLIFTANAIDTSVLYSLIFKYLKNWLNNEVQTGTKLLLPLDSRKNIIFSSANFYHDKKFYFKNSGISLLPLPIRFLERQNGFAKGFKLYFESSMLKLYWRESKVTNVIKIGIKGQFMYSRVLLYDKKYRIASLGYFKDEKTFMIKVVFLEYPYSSIIQFDFLNAKKIFVHIKEKPCIDDILDHYGNMLSFLPFHQMNTWIISKSYHLISSNATAIYRK